MKENPEFTGLHHDEEKKEELQEVLHHWSQEAAKPIEGELEKTEEDIATINTVNTLIQDELRLLGIEKYEPATLENVHLLPAEVYEREVADPGSKAFFRSTDDIVYVNKDICKTKEQYTATLLHELIHRASTATFYLDPEHKDISDARVGYRLASSWKSEKPTRLKEFNEQMVDLTTYKILSSNRDLLAERLGITSEDIDSPIYSYMEHGDIINSIINQVAEDTHTTPLEVFSKLERGQFEHTLFALKDIQHSFGKGSLEVLSVWGSLEDAGDNNTLTMMVKDFFMEKDAGKRHVLHAQIMKFTQEHVQ